MKSTYLEIEAVLCGLPSFLAGSVGALIFSYTGFSMLEYAPAEGSRGIVLAIGIVLALWQYFSLAVQTVSGVKYHLGLLFWTAAFFGSWWVWCAFNLGTIFGSVIAVPIVTAAVHFIWIQLRQQAGKCGPT
ncbi:hypothetical protein HH212_19230 [Massilia forsythiae]|uniref:Uncharacterized protein n=1 Tax=Massilia forsythiae TaxID=2728020 RepID=A0A7Z2VZB4_9BURK|nr:hypothetical protein [Massilia forsythiae]QJE01889.1 hypothetical protein HH212_19230 [Massilia forsythiae]